MGIAYNPATRSWSIAPEKTDYKFDYPTDAFDGRKTDYFAGLPTNLPTNLKTNHDDVYTQWRNSGGEQNLRWLRGLLNGLYVTYLGRYPSTGEVEGWRSHLRSLGWVSGKGVDTEPWGRLLQQDIASSQEAGSLQQTYANNRLLNQQNAFNNSQNAQKNADANVLNGYNANLNQQARSLNEKNRQLNEEAIQLNKDNTLKNETYTKTLQVAASTQGGDYITQRDKFDTQQLIAAGLSPGAAAEAADAIQGQFKSFYLTEKLQRWDPNLGVQPPYGVFDPDYYKIQNPVVAEAYAKAKAIDDIDITERYGEEGYYLQHYTNIGKNQGLRGNKEEDTVSANRYIEEQLTDKEIQDIRDYQLGVDTETVTERLLNIPEVSNEWAKARNGDPYWNQLANEKYLDPLEAEDFSVLFRLSDRPEDKQILFNMNITGGDGISQLEDAINETVKEKREFDIKKFAAVNQSILKDAVAQMKRVQAEQEMLSFYKGFSGFTEVVDINKELVNSILGDTGVGGLLAFTSGGKAEESLLNSLQNLSGMRNSITYNWQQWFDQAIKDKYGIDYAVFEPLEEKRDILDAFTNKKLTEKPFDETKQVFNQAFLEDTGFSNTEDLIKFLQSQGEEGELILNTIKGDPSEESRVTLLPILSRVQADIRLLDETKNRDLALAYTTKDAVEMMNIEAQFARDYIDEYLNPRFNTSRSMDEFIEYLDVRQEQQSPFEKEDNYLALADLSQKYTESYLDQVKLEEARYFDPNFYFDPTGDIAREQQYKDQKATVEEDWEKAKTGDEYWNVQAYRFGVDVNNKAAFARMHFEVKGQGKGFDAAEDIVNAGKIQDFIYDTVVPVLKEEAFKSKPVFGQFITPEEFADEMLKGLDPYNTPDEWKEILQRYGLQEFGGTVSEMKNYIVESLRAGSGQDIREQIKYLNEKRQKPTQEILGVTYIKRPEDYKDEMAKPTTELYAVFQKSGYQGTEDEFYENFFPDLDRSEQVLLTKAGKDDTLKAYGLDLRDPFSSLGTIESFFPESQTALDDEEDQEAANIYNSYFRLDEDENIDYKSSAGKEFLGEFTSMFRGL